MFERWIAPDWEAPSNVRTLVTTRQGGVSLGAFAGLNLGDHVGDDPAHVEQNRALLRTHLPAEPKWLKQVHGVAVADADAMQQITEADAAISRKTGTVCAVLTADCLPLLLCDTAGTVVAAAHAGWRGLASGVIESTVAAMKVEPVMLMAYLGPAIGPHAFEVGEEVRQVFLAQDQRAEQAFVPGAPADAGEPRKWVADIYFLARLRLHKLGVERVHGGEHCTVSDPLRFYSYRRDGVTGRMASLIWLERTT